MVREQPSLYICLFLYKSTIYHYIKIFVSELFMRECIMKSVSLLIVDDEITQLQTLSGYLKKQGYTIFGETDSEKAVKILERETIDLVLTDFRMPKMDGLSLLREVKRQNPDIGIIVMTAFGSVEDAVEAMKVGADDYLQKPIDLDQLDLVLHKLLEHRRLIHENRALKTALAEKYKFNELVTGSALMDEVLNMAGRSAGSKATILLRGENGTGKSTGKLFLSA